jgi:hypothetical protein
LQAAAAAAGKESDPPVAAEGALCYVVQLPLRGGGRLQKRSSGNFADVRLAKSESGRGSHVG